MRKGRTDRKPVSVELCRKEVAQQSAALGCLPIHYDHAAVARLIKRLRIDLCSEPFSVHACLERPEACTMTRSFRTHEHHLAQASSNAFQMHYTAGVILVCSKLL